jgi:hypothetical protein
MCCALVVPVALKARDGDELKAVLASSDADAAVSAINGVVFSENPQKSLDVLAFALLSFRRGMQEPLSKVLRNDDVLISAIRALQQGRRNGLSVRIAEKDLREMMLEKTKSNDRLIRLSAISALSDFDNPADVPLLTQIALGGDRGEYRASALALVRMCNPAARAAVSRIRSEEKRSDRRSFLREIEEEERKAQQVGLGCR